MSNNFIDNSGIEPVLSVKAELINSSGYSRYSIINSLEIRYGQSANTCSVFVPLTDDEPEDFIPFTVTGTALIDMLRLDIIDINNQRFSHYFYIKSFGQSIRGDKRGVNYNLEDFMRGCFLDSHPVFKEYNNFNSQEAYDPQSQDTKYFGFWFTNQYGQLEFIEKPSTPDNPTNSLIDAYHAILDIFYTPSRTLRLGFPYPELYFGDNEVISVLKDFKIKATTFNPSSQLNAIGDILNQIGGRYDIYTWSEGFNIEDQKALITRKGKGPTFNQIVDSSSRNLCDKINDYHLPNGYSSGGDLFTIRDESQINFSKKVDAVVYMGAPRQYLVKNAPILPAWDWWNDYDIIVRNSSNNKIISLNLDDGNPNPDYPAWLRNWSGQFENLKNSFSQFSTDSEEERLYIFKIISEMWGSVLHDFTENTQNSGDIIPYYINLVVMDAIYVNPTDPIHQYRFKRYIAVREDDFNNISNIDMTIGWDNPELRRYRRIKNTLIDGKKHDVSEIYLSDLLSRRETYSISVPPIIEGFLPDYYSSGDNNQLGVDNFQLQWTMMDSVSIDSEHGFFVVGNPRDTAVYFDRSKVKVYGDDAQPLNYKTFPFWIQQIINNARKENGLGPPLSFSANPEKEPYYKTQYMMPGGLRQVRVLSEYIPFRTKMRGTFYYDAAQNYTDSKYEGNGSFTDDYDIIDGAPSFNEHNLSGIYPESQNVGTLTKFGYIVDTSMILQSDEGLFSSSSNPIVKFLQNGVIKNLQNETGKIYVTLEWQHRNDYSKLRDKAKRIYEESSIPEISGFIVVPEMLVAGSSGNVLIDSGNGFGLGMILYNGIEKPITDIAHQFPNISATIGFDYRISRVGKEFDRFEIPKIRATEIFKNIAPKEFETQKQRKEAAHGQNTRSNFFDPNSPENNKDKKSDNSTGIVTTLSMASNFKQLDGLAQAPHCGLAGFANYLVHYFGVNELGVDLEVDDNHPEWDSRYIAPEEEP